MQKSSRKAKLEASAGPAITAAPQPLPVPESVIDRIRESLLAGERMIDYAELARRMDVSVDTARGLVAARIIRPAVRRGSVVRFHWPSVVDQLIRHSI